MEFIKGKWYKGFGNSGQNIIKFDYIKNNKEYWSTAHKINDYDLEKRNAWSNLNTDYTQQELTIEELKSILPPDHPDLQELTFDISIDL